MSPFPAFFSSVILVGSLSFLEAFTVKPRTSRVSPLCAGTVVELDDSNYVKLFKGDTPVLVDACAPWCGPCKLIEPVVERAAKSWGESLVVARFNVEARNPNLKMEMLLQQVMPTSLPSLILFHGEKALVFRNGMISDEELSEFLESNLPQKEKLQKVPTRSGTKSPGMISFASQGDDYMLTDG
jgi:thioredoxin 1